jgi:hypothetical protein
MKIVTSVFLLLLAVAPAALANSASTLNAPSKPKFIDYQIPTGGTATLTEGVGPRGNVRWELKGQASDTLYTFTFDFDHTQSPTDFYFYSPFSFSGNGVSYRGTIIQAHIDGAGLLTAGWTGSGHGRLTFQLYYKGTGCSTNPLVQCLTLGTGTFSVATTPEPGSLPLMATGLLAMAAAVRRKIAKLL